MFWDVSGAWAVRIMNEDRIECDRVEDALRAIRAIACVNIPQWEDGFEDE